MGALYRIDMHDDERRLKRTSTSVSSLTTASSLRSVDINPTTCDKVKRQTILALVIPGITVVTLGGIILPVSFLIGVALFSFGTILMLPLPLLIWRMKATPSLPFQRDVDEMPLPAPPSVTPKDVLYGRLRPNGMVEDSDSASSYDNYAYESFQPTNVVDPVKTIFDPATMWLDQKEIISPIPIKPMVDHHQPLCCPQCQANARNTYIVTTNNTIGRTYVRPPPPLYSTVVRESPLI